MFYAKIIAFLPTVIPIAIEQSYLEGRGLTEIEWEQQQ